MTKPKVYHSDYTFGNVSSSRFKFPEKYCTFTVIIFTDEKFIETWCASDVNLNGEMRS